MSDQHEDRRPRARRGSRSRRRATAGSSGSSRCSPTGSSKAGHDVTLFASGDSRTKAKLAWVYEQAPSEQIGRSLPELRHVLSAYERAGRVRRDQRPHRVTSAPCSAGSSRRRSCTPCTGRSTASRASVYESIERVAPKVGLISLSLNQRRPKPDLNWVANIPNALDLEHYPCQPHRGDYLLFLGRMNHEKGAHRAVAVAMELGLPLKLAGKVREPKEQEYFAEFIEPHLGNGIEYLGEVNARQEGRAAPERARDALPDRVGGAVRPGDDRVDGLRDAGDRDPPRRGARGDRGGRRRR